jgi:voltage-gated potassium channel
LLAEAVHLSLLGLVVQTLGASHAEHDRSRRCSCQTRCRRGNATEEAGVRRLWRDQRVRSLLGLVAILVVYFTAPVEGDKSVVRLVLDIAITIAAVAVVVMVTGREFRRMQVGESLRLTGAQLLIVLEIVLVVFSGLYYTMARHGTHEMSGLHTRVDALYFTATTIATVGYGDIHSVGQLARVVNTVQLVFDILFIAIFVRLLATATGQRQARLAQENAERLAQERGATEEPE